MNKVKLGDVCRVQGGYAFKSDEFQENKVPVIRIGNIQESKVLIDDNICYTEEFLNNHPEFEIKKGDILIAMSGATVGKVGNYLCESRALLNQRVGKFVITGKLEKRYLYFLLQSPLFEKFILNNAFGCAQPNISNKKIEEFEFYDYEVEEQIEIATKLDIIQKIIDIRKKQIEELNQLIKSQFVEMFQNEKYIKIKLGEEFDVSSGGTPSKSKEEYWKSNDISWIGSNMCQNKIIYENDGKYISYSGLEHSSAKIYPIDTVLVALVGATIGKTALLKFETATNQNIAGIQVSERFNAEYVYFAIQNLYYKFTELSKGTFKMANLSFVRDLEIPMPPIELQNQFADIVKKIDTQKFVIQNSLEEVQKLQESLISKYFGGYNVS